MSSVAAVGKTFDYGRMASGKRINSAKDGASELFIANKLKSQSKGLNVGKSNAAAGQGAINIADGAMGGITDYLQRIREIGVKASNGLNSAADKEAMQMEVDSLLKGVQQTATGTQYNTMNLLDGSMASMDLATNPDGTGMSIQMSDSTLSSLGIAGFDVRGNFDLKTIDDAISKISSSRSNMGATYNSLDYLGRNNSNTSMNLTGARSKLEDLDMPKAISKMKQDEVLGNYKNIMLKKKMENDNMVTGLFQ